VGSLPKETCETINDSWGFNIKDENHKSLKTLVQYLVKAAGYDANFLLNVGPMPNGEIQPEHKERLKQMGEWLAKNGETIYGTRGGPLTPRDWGVTTQKGDKVYVHVLDWTDESLILPAWGKRVKAARVFGSKDVVKFSQNEFGITIKIPASARNEIDTIIELETK